MIPPIISLTTPLRAQHREERVREGHSVQLCELYSAERDQPRGAPLPSHVHCSGLCPPREAVIPDWHKVLLRLAPEVLISFLAPTGICSLVPHFLSNLLLCEW